MAQSKVKHPIHHGVAKVPVVMQMEALECGAASLCMVLAYYNKWIPLEQVRADCGVSRDGSNARNLLRAARSYGLKADGYRVEPDELEREGTFPCIVHWELNHFVVCDGFRGDKVYLNDPANGACSVSRERFNEAFTGVALIMEPGEDFVPSGKPKSVIDFARKRLKGTAAAAVFIVLTTVIASLTNILNSGFTRGTQQELGSPLLLGTGTPHAVAACERVDQCGVFPSRQRQDGCRRQCKLYVEGPPPSHGVLLPTPGR